MANSIMPEDWVARQVANNPFSRLENGNIRTCPVRLNYVWLTDPKKSKNDDGSDKKPSYESCVLFPPGAEQGLALMWQLWCEEARRVFPQNWNAQGQPFGLHWPLHPCDEKQNKPGFTPGLQYVNIGSQFKPQIVDGAMNPIVDPSRVYPGVWAILALNTYDYGHSPPRPKKGISFGLQSVMIIADDEKLFDGGGSDARVDFAGVKVDATYNPTGAFGTAPAPGAPAMPGVPSAGIMPPPQRVAPPAAPAAPDWDPING